MKRVLPPVGVSTQPLPTGSAALLATPPHGGARGFTLVEVLVALAVIAVALGAGLRAAGALTDNAERLQTMSAAQWCAENQLTELKLQGQFPGVGESDFRCTQLGREFRGSQRVQATPNPNCRRADAAVASDTGASLLSITTIVCRVR